MIDLEDINPGYIIVTLFIFVFSLIGFGVYHGVVLNEMRARCHFEGGIPLSDGSSTFRCLRNSGVLWEETQ